MNIAALYHCPKSNYAFANSLSEIRIRFRTAKDDVQSVRLYYGIKYDWANKTSVMMERIFSDRYFDYYQYNIRQEDIRLGYYFEVIENDSIGDETVIYTEAGVMPEFDDSRAHCLYFQYPSVHSNDIPSKPAWYGDAVFYQIFVERFANGNPDISPKDLVPWDAAPTPTAFYGGDLVGIRKNLPYLQALGINAIYLTPIFESVSNHKYDTIDYFKIDPHFGDKEDLRKLVEGAHEKGIRIVLDAVFNHCSERFAPFQDVLKNGEQSQFKDWFHIKSFPVSMEEPNYEMFASVPYMPRLNTENPEVQKYLFEVVTYWTTEFQLDGWRLDVADEPGHCFWREFRKVVKSLSEDVIIIGELWHDAMPWLQGDQFDTVMNYAVTHQVTNYIAKENMDALEFSENLAMQLMKYPDCANEMMFNLLDSHDTERFLYLCEEDVTKLMNAAAFQLAYLGTPCIYYGTEIGLSGGYDPGCRRGFNWHQEEWHQALHTLYRRLIQLRKTERVLRDGKISFRSTKELFIMERSLAGETIYIVINQTGQSQTLPPELISGDVQELIYGQPISGKMPPHLAHYYKKI